MTRSYRGNINNGECQSVLLFRYLESLLKSENQISNKTKDKLKVGNRCCFAVKHTFRLKNVSRISKIRIVKAILMPVASETWIMTKVHEDFIMWWEKKILRRIYRGVQVDGTWGINKCQAIRFIWWAGCYYGYQARKNQMSRVCLTKKEQWRCFWQRLGDWWMEDVEEAEGLEDGEGKVEVYKKN